MISTWGTPGLKKKKCSVMDNVFAYPQGLKLSNSEERQISCFHVCLMFLVYSQFIQQAFWTFLRKSKLLFTSLYPRGSLLVHFDCNHLTQRNKYSESTGGLSSFCLSLFFSVAASHSSLSKIASKLSHKG